MPIRDEQKYTFVPFGLTDSTDGTQAPPGSLAVCSDIVVSPSDQSLFVPRPAAVKMIDLASINPTGVVSCFLQLGNIVYGMISSATFPGKDEPFAANVKTGALLTVSGVSSALLPATQPNTGDWTPPTMVAIGGRIIVTHPGFVGGANPYFGWFDISSFSSAAFTGATLGNTTSGSNAIQSLVTPVGNSAPILSGYQPGMAVSGAGIPAGTTITKLTNGIFSLATTGNTTAGSPSVASVANLTGVQVGMLASGPNIPAGTTVTNISGTTVTLSQNAIATATASGITFTGGGTITLSQNATATANSVALTITGGSATAPLWGAGNTNTFPLTLVPVCAGGFNGRAWFGVGNFAVYSDVLNPTQVSQGSQAVTIGDPTTITAMDSVPLTSQLTGGIQQSLTIYKGAGSFFQITGDALTNNLLLNAVTGSVGPLAVNTIAQTPKGALAIAADGMRLLGLTGVQSDLIGAWGQGVVAPFITGALTTRMSAAYADGVYRVAVAATTLAIPGFTVTAQEYWYHVETNRWTGPHRFPSQLVQATGDGTSFLVTSWLYPAAIFRSDPIPSANSVFLENTTRAAAQTQMGWTMQSSLLPDPEQLAYMQVIRGALSCQLATTGDIQVDLFAMDPGSAQVSFTIRSVANTAPIWGAVAWGAFSWGGSSLPFGAKPLIFSQALVGRQLVLKASCAISAFGQKIGSFNLGYQLTGYNSPIFQ